jgi:DNA-binding response OmpR family regulator
MGEKLANVVVADPVERAAKLIARSCERFATKSVVVATGEELLRVAQALRPELTILSLELHDPDTAEIIHELRRQSRKTHLVVTFRELAVPDMQRLTKLGIEDMLPQPVDAVALARLVWLRFKINSRAHERYNVAIDVHRADGLLLGQTRNLSEGGMLLADLAQPLTSRASLLFGLMLPNDKPVLVRGSILAVEGQEPSPTWARVRFEQLRGSEQERLAAFLRSLVSERSPQR